MELLNGNCFVSHFSASNIYKHTKYPNAYTKY